MSTTVVTVLCGAGGLVMGWLSSIVVERVPAKRSLLERPFPELRAALRDPAAILMILTTGAVAAGTGARFGGVWELPAFFVLAVVLVALSVIDLRLFLLPNRIVFPLAVATFVLLAVAAIANNDGDALLRALACGGGAFAAFTTLHLVSPRAMGFGDVKLAFVLGLALGWLGVGETLLGLFLGFVYGSIVGVVLIATRIRSRKDHVPFGPFLAAGTLTAVLVGYAILDWYRG
jgi:leader peptidase (prepilin peptidase) / N-methyltransferase